MGNKKHNKKKGQKIHKDVITETTDKEERDDSITFPEETDVNLKRSINDDSDNDEKPTKKKKKKNQQVNQDSTDKKGKKSIRQMKREKHLERMAEAQAISSEQLKSQCLNYLSQWKHDKQNWKFMKVKQIWLNKNKFSEKMIPDASWPTLIEYFDSAQGNIRNVLLEDANKIIKEMDDWTESQKAGKDKSEDNDELDSNPESNRPSQIAYKRARDLIQSLQ